MNNQRNDSENGENTAGKSTPKKGTPDESADTAECGPKSPGPPAVVRDFLAFLSVSRGCSEKTVQEYERDLYTFFDFLIPYRRNNTDNRRQMMAVEQIEHKNSEYQPDRLGAAFAAGGTGGTRDDSETLDTMALGGTMDAGALRTQDLGAAPLGAGGLDAVQNWPAGIDAALLRSVTQTDLNRYVAWLRTEKQVSTGRADTASKGLAPATTRRRAACLRSFFRYLTETAGILERDPSAGLTVPKKNAALPFFFTEEECRALLNAVDGLNRERDYAIVLLALVSGLRVSELVSLNVHDIRTSDGLYFFRVTGKGGKERQIFLSPNCVEALNQYLDIRDTAYQPELSGGRTAMNGRPAGNASADRDALFLSRKHGRLSVDAVQSLVKRAARRAGLTPVSPHKLRHTAASLMLGHGVDIRTISEVLGHSSISSTQIYTHLQSAQLIEACRANPVSRMEGPDSSPVPDSNPIPDSSPVPDSNPIQDGTAANSTPAPHHAPDSADTQDGAANSEAVTEGAVIPDNRTPERKIAE